MEKAGYLLPSDYGGGHRNGLAIVETRAKSLRKNNGHAQAFLTRVAALGWLETCTELGQDAQTWSSPIQSSHSIAVCFAAVLCSGVMGARADEVDPTRADLLRARYGEMQGQLQHSAFQRPIELSSTETSAEETAEVYALVDFPFSSVNDARVSPRIGATS
jgi:hypothetical protein